MSGRDQRIRDKRIRAEAAALWRELYGEAPPMRADAAELLEILLRSLPDLTYERITSPHLRPAAMSFPRSK